jgi:hypothetical protein
VVALPAPSTKAQNVGLAHETGLDDVPIIMAAGAGRNVHVPDRHTPVPCTSAVGVDSSVVFSTRQNFVVGQDTP